MENSHGAIVKEIYIITRKFPKEEMYALTSQIKRASVSIPAIIAEGMGRQYKKDTLQFLYISRGSIYEVETLLNIAVLIDIIKEHEFLKILPVIDSTRKLLNGLINYTEKTELK